MPVITTTEKQAYAEVAGKSKEIVTDVTGANVFVQKATTNKHYLSPRMPLPNSPTTNTNIGTTVTSYDIGTTATWDGYKWIYTTNYGCTTSNRPSLTVNNFDKYSQVFGTTLGKPIWWNGSDWVAATGAVV